MVYRSLLQSTALPMVRSMIPADKTTFNSDNCDQQPDQSDFLSDDSHSNVMDSEVVDIKQECDSENDQDGDALISLISSQLRNAGHEMFRGADAQQTDDTERNMRDRKMYRNSAWHKKHTTDKLYECDVCHKTFRYPCLLTRHKVVHTAVKRFTCDICNKAFTHSSDLTRHKHLHHGESVYVCEVCLLAFTDIGALNKHKVTHCGITPHDCNNTFPRRTNLNAQKCVQGKWSKHEDVKLFTCDICNKAFTRSSDVIRHKRIHSSEKPYVCDVCLMAFTDASSVYRHRWTHFGIRPYVCNICNKSHACNDDLVKHKHIHSKLNLSSELHHNMADTDVKEEENDVNDENENALLNLTSNQLINELLSSVDGQQTDDTEHTDNSNTSEQMYINSTSHETHTAQRRHECDVCHKTFRYFSALNYHKDAVHNGIKPFTCDICNKAFSSICHLTRHKRIHSGERPFACDVCLLTFVDVSTLYKHKRTHSGLRPYVCNTCNKTFTRSDDLVRHTRIHRARPYTCNECDATFACMSNLILHKLTHSELVLADESHSNVMDSEGVGVQEEQEDIKDDRENALSNLISTEQCNDVEDMLIGSIYQQTDDTHYTWNSNQYPQTYKHVIDTEGVGVQEEQDVNDDSDNALSNLISTEQCNDVEDMLIDAAHLQTDDTECIWNSNQYQQTYKHSNNHKTHTANKSQERDACRTTFENPGELDRHKHVRSCIKRYSCDICNKAFSCVSHLTRHKRIHSGERPFACDVCLLTFVDVSTLYKHKRTHSGVRPYVCNVCNKDFRRSDYLVRHKRIHMSTPYICNECNAAFPCMSDLILHMRIHTDCDSNVMDSERVDVKEKDDYVNEDVGNALSNLISSELCNDSYDLFSGADVTDVCRTTIECSSERTKHKYVHSGIKRYTCDICSKVFSSISHLTRHERIHSGERPFACDVCLLTFVDVSTLYKHKRTHSGLRPYVCNTCNKAYARNDYLVRHKCIRSELTEQKVAIKRFNCDICNKAFTRSRDVTRHKRIHSGE